MKRKVIKPPKTGKRFCAEENDLFAVWKTRSTNQTEGGAGRISARPAAKVRIEIEKIEQVGRGLKTLATKRSFFGERAMTNRGEAAAEAGKENATANNMQAQ